MRRIDRERGEEKRKEGDNRRVKEEREDIERRERDRDSDSMAADRRLHWPTASLLLQLKLKPHSDCETSL